MRNVNEDLSILWCCGCRRNGLVVRQDVADLREDARAMLDVLAGRSGWTRDGDVIWCPLCVRQRRPEPSPTGVSLDLPRPDCL